MLISAYSCEPGKGSEPGIGWNWVRQAARFHNVWIITRANNAGPIEDAMDRCPLPGVTFIYYDTPKWMRFWKRKGRNVHLYYYLWQLGAYRVARKLHRSVGFDVAHHVTFGAYWMPTLLSLLGIPFIWGPIGGGESSPRAFRRSFGVRGRSYEVLRDIARALARLDPFVKHSVRHATLTLATTAETQSRLQELGCRKVEVLSQVGLPEVEISQLESIALRKEAPFRVLSLGRFLHWKGFSLGIEAFRKLLRLHPDSEYWLIGDGPEEKRLKRLTATLGISDRVCLISRMPRTEVLRRLQDCDVLLHPSLHESGAWVCLEAMAAGRPVVCFDLGGPGLIVTEETGIKVPAITPTQGVAALASALLRLAEDPALRRRMGMAARSRVKAQFRWDGKGDPWSEVSYLRFASSIAAQATN